MQEIKITGQSLDIVRENVMKLKQLFPEIVTEEKIDFDKLKAVLGEYIEKNDESYRFTWYGKKEAFRKSQIPSTGTLRPCIEESKDWDTTQNLYIEGDNLEVLKLLQKSYNNKIKMIYIDPPYNKDKDFIYPDKWSDPINEYKKITGQINEDGNVINSDTEGEGGRHTKWLNMMYPRLILARNLLTNDGIICIQIDDAEFENLKKLCNEVYGEENFVGSVCVKMSHLSGMKMSHKDKKIPKIKEFILIYVKSKDYLNINTVYIPGKWEEVLNRYTKFVEKTSDDCENWEVVSLSQKLKQLNISDPSDKEKFCIENADCIFRTAVNDSLANMPKDNTFHKVITKTGLEKYVYNSEEVLFANTKLQLFDGQLLPAETVGDIWVDIGINNLHKEGEINFPNGKKPFKLLDRLVSMFTGENDIILDFFSGSSSTAHGVIWRNSIDNKKRKFIMVQLPENLQKQYEQADEKTKKDIKILIDFLNSINKPLYLTEIGKERIRRTGESIKAEVKGKFEEYYKKEQSIFEGEEQVPMNPDNLDIGFKVFKLDSSNLKKWSVDVGEDFYKESKDEQNAILSKLLGFEIDNFVEGRTELDVVYEIMLKYGLDLTYPIETFNFDGTNVYSIGYGGLIVCLDKNINAELADKIVDLIKEIEPSMVRVAVRDLSFTSDAAKTNFKETLKNGVYAYFESTDDKADKQNQFKFITI